MKQKLVSILCTAVLIGVMATGCGGNDSANKSDNASDVTPTEAVTEEPTDTPEEEDKAADDKTSDADTSESDAAENATTEAALADGIYSAEFDTDNGMFHVNEANEGLGVLTVENGKMTIHVSLVSKNIVNLFVGTAEDAQKDGAEILQPTTDTVTYADGMSEEVYGFDIPVPVLDEEFDVALVGTKGKWYDHKVSVSNPQPQ